MRQQCLHNIVRIGNIELFVEFRIAVHVRQRFLAPQLADREIIEHDADHADQSGQIIQPDNAEDRHDHIPHFQNDVQRTVIRPCQIAEHNDNQSGNDLENSDRQHGRGSADVDPVPAHQVKAADINMKHGKQTYKNAKPEIAEECAPVHMLNVMHLHPAVFVMRLILFQMHDLRFFIFKGIHNLIFLICHSYSPSFPYCFVFFQPDRTGQSSSILPYSPAASLCGMLNSPCAFALRSK